MTVSVSLESNKIELMKEKLPKSKPAGNIRKLQAESEDAQMSSEALGALLREVSKASMEEINRLIIELQTLLRKLQTDGDRIERDIMEYASLSEQATQLTKIVFEGVKQLPARAIGEAAA